MTLLIQNYHESTHTIGIPISLTLRDSWSDCAEENGSTGVSPDRLGVFAEADPATYAALVHGVGTEETRYSVV